VNKPAPITLSDGRTQAIDHAAYQAWVKTLSDEALFHIIRDARQAEVAMPDGPKAGYYADEVNYCASEVASRRGARAALDLGRATVVHSHKPTVRPSSLEEVNRSLVGQAQGGMTASPDGTANRRQVKEITVKKNNLKVGDEVFLSKPDVQDKAAGLGLGVIGHIVGVSYGLVDVDWEVEEETPNPRRHDCGGKARQGHGWTVLGNQVLKVKKARKTADWKYIRGTASTANYLEATDSNQGIFIKGKDGQDINVHLGFNGDISITLWGKQGRVDFGADERLSVETRRF